MSSIIFTGTTVTFGTSGFTAELLGVSWGGVQRGAIDQSHSGSSNAMSFLPADLYDPGEMTMNIHHKTTALPPLNGATETVTVMFSDSNTWSASGLLPATSSPATWKTR